MLFDLLLIHYSHTTMLDERLLHHQSTQYALSFINTSAIPPTAEEITIFQSRRSTPKRSTRIKHIAMNSSTITSCPNSRPMLNASNCVTMDRSLPNIPLK